MSPESNRQLIDDGKRLPQNSLKVPMPKVRPPRPEIPRTPQTRAPQVRAPKASGR